MAMLKLNKLHLHLTDDNGWRIEIKRYPLLTEIGSRRVERPGAPFFAQSVSAPSGRTHVEKALYGRMIFGDCILCHGTHIEVIPEIEMPAHSNAALASYPLLACPVVDNISGCCRIGGAHADIIYCAGNDSVYTFLEGVIDEIVDLFPSRYIHLGGDEAWKVNWKKCPRCQARMKAEG